MDLSTIISRTTSLITPPDVYFEISALIDSPTSSVNDICAVLELDPNLSARLLKLVNSAFYGVPGTIDTVSRAVALIGLEELKSVVMAATVADTFNQLRSEHISVDTFWRHSVFTGLAAKALAKRRGLERPERLFTAGMLHDIGQLVLYAQLPDQAQQLLTQMNRRLELRETLERERFGFDHAEVGARLLRHWQLPESLCLPVRFHHQPAAAPHYGLESTLLHVANALANGHEPSLRRQRLADDAPPASGQQLGLGLTQQVWAQSGLTPDCLDGVLDDSNCEFFEILQLTLS